jgi:hypothetical protein
VIPKKLSNLLAGRLHFVHWRFHSSITEKRAQAKSIFQFDVNGSVVNQPLATFHGPASSTEYCMQSPFLAV